MNKFPDMVVTNIFLQNSSNDEVLDLLDYKLFKKRNHAFQNAT